MTDTPAQEQKAEPLFRCECELICFWAVLERHLQQHPMHRYGKLKVEERMKDEKENQKL